MAKEKIVIQMVDDDYELRQDAVYHVLERNDYHSYRKTVYANEKTIQRWVVNYIRHYLTNYDDLLYRKKKPQQDILKENVLKLIAEHYPLYRNECYRQIREIY